MRLDQGSFIFTPNGECPSWETALGQSKSGKDDNPPYYFKAEGYENILTGMFFNIVPIEKITCVLGKQKTIVQGNNSYLFSQTQEIQLASKFDSIVVHVQGKKDFLPSNAPIILLLTKIQDPGKNHFGRRSIKYSPHTTFDNIRNEDSFKKIQAHYTEQLSCYGLLVEHFDTLHLYCTNTNNNDSWSDLKLPEKDWTDWVDWERQEKQKYKTNSSTGPSTPFDADAPVQIIYYGVPGCGKSNKINEALKGVPDERKIRTVFHPEYTNADFVGQILPKTDGGNISYEFTPGPFTEILKRAGQEPGKDFYLIIEEINRGNAAAIFGDIFQLLDRDENGVSQYSIQNKDIAQYINSQDNSIRLPKNLSIIATMNTSDQNVFTLDNAFQRRFDMVLVRSGVTRSEKAKAPSPDSKVYNFEPDDGAIRDQFESKIEGTNIPWGFFWDWVNSEIAGTLRGLSGTEDKRLGLWFVKNKNGEIPKKVFAEKVLKYLWDDAFKFKRKEIFCENIQSLESLIDTFEKCKNLSEIFRDFPKDAIQNKA